VEVAIMAEKVFKLKLNAITKAFIHRSSHCISSDEIPTFKITFTLQYKSINSVTRASDWKEFHWDEDPSMPS
jgi:hypothetical protein